ncbi:hypothetical protein OUZ56_008354 [Daphnia magna]|uniref:Uncharacterized protein n=1 Tax=Daphnia magna TaxID=35525 RepID=A0ABR0ACP9_9CRUS|nr:hypothetical protein OUZ56_008354 [Daphnia magna]
MCCFAHFCRPKAKCETEYLDVYVKTKQEDAYTHVFVYLIQKNNSVLCLASLYSDIAQVFSHMTYPFEF